MTCRWGLWVLALLYCNRSSCLTSVLEASTALIQSTPGCITAAVDGPCECLPSIKLQELTSRTGHRVRMILRDALSPERWESIPTWSAVGHPRLSLSNRQVRSPFILRCPITCLQNAADQGLFVGWRRSRRPVAC